MFSLRFKPSLTAALLGAISQTPAVAATGTVTFSGTVTEACTLVIGPSGKLTTTSAMDTLSTKNPSGEPATVDITTTGGVRFSVDGAPTATGPVTDTTPTLWTPSYSMTGTQSVTETTASTLLTGSGARNVKVHLEGRKTGSDTFKNGTYTGTVTVRCE